MSGRTPGTPQRRCIICRRSCAKDQLLRVVYHESRLVLDEKRVLPGRGAYVHRLAVCASKAGEKRRWLQALRLDGKELSDESVRELTLGLLQQIRGLDCAEEKRHDDASLGEKQNGKVPKQNGRGNKIRL